ncbi:isocitrate dehydrogenase kinase/phosphatase-domain containing protein [Halomonas sp. KX33721]|uniref:isocitrate dehydrogenase kinase/phosphatase-domain containing protein n=1 Tax=Halomonas sp. KX33721 TaxID=1819251 RepID=UPI0033B46C7D
MFFLSNFVPLLCQTQSTNSFLLSTHPELVDVSFWKQAQQNIKKGHVSHIYPYPTAQRFIHHW